MNLNESQRRAADNDDESRDGRLFPDTAHETNADQNRAVVPSGHPKAGWGSRNKHARVQRVSRNGNSLSIHLPTAILRQAGLRQGDDVVLTVMERSIIITPVSGGLDALVRKDIERFAAQSKQDGEK